MKAMLTPHKPGDSGILCLPLKSNVPNGHKNWKLVRCPICGAECWESELAREAMGTEPNITAACTRCALQGKRRSTRAFSGAPDGSSSDPLPECVGKIMELEEALNRQIDQMVERRQAIERAIDSLPLADSAQVLRYRYIDGMTWEKIAVEMNYTYRWVLRLHNRALTALTIPWKENRP